MATSQRVNESTLRSALQEQMQGTTWKARIDCMRTCEVQALEGGHDSISKLTFALAPGIQI